MKKKAQLKGMTLIEIVISMALYAVIAFLIAQIMTNVNATMRATHQLNERLSAEVKYADNRMVTGGDVSAEAQVRTDSTRSQISISYDGGTQDFDADVYTAIYENKDGTPTAVNTNYRYVVYSTHASSGPDWTAPFTLNVRIPSSGYSWIDLDKAEVTNTVNGSTATGTIVANGTDGVFNLYQIVIPRIQESVGTGVGRVHVTFNRDLTSQTGGVRKEIYETDSTGSYKLDGSGNKILLGYSDNFPFLKLDLDYCQWFANAAGEVTPANFFSRVSFTVNEDNSVTAGRSER